jgi:hypothetical protein
MVPGLFHAVRDAMDSAVKRALHGLDLDSRLTYSIRCEAVILGDTVEARAYLCTARQAGMPGVSGDFNK